MARSSGYPTEMLSPIINKLKPTTRAIFVETLLQTLSSDR